MGVEQRADVIAHALDLPGAEDTWTRPLSPASVTAAP